MLIQKLFNSADVPYMTEAVAGLLDYLNTDMKWSPHQEFQGTTS
jgi:hypothetical protein